MINENERQDTAQKASSGRIDTQTGASQQTQSRLSVRMMHEEETFGVRQE